MSNHSFHDQCPRLNAGYCYLCKHGSPLTPRETTIIKLIRDEVYSNEDIGRCLDIKPTGVKSHIRNIVSKLYARNREHAVIVALQHGWIK